MADFDYQKVLKRAGEILPGNLALRNVLRKLVSRDALEDDEVAEIEALPGGGKQVEQLLKLLRTHDVNAYIVFMTVLEEERKDLYTKVKALETGPRPTPTPTVSAHSTANLAQQVTEVDCSKIADKIKVMEQRDDFFLALGISLRDVKAKEAEQRNVKLVARDVLLLWRQKEGRAATRQVVIDKLGELKCNDDKEKLLNEWQ